MGEWKSYVDVGSAACCINKDLTVNLAAAYGEYLWRRFWGIMGALYITQKESTFGVGWNAFVMLCCFEGCWTFL